MTRPSSAPGAPRLFGRGLTPPASGSAGRGSVWRAALLYTALTLLLAYPVSMQPACRMLPLGPDGDLFMWTLGWDTHAFLSQPLSIFDANIYHPRQNTLAYSENLIGSAFLAAPILWITGDPVLAMNLVALLSCVLCGVGAYVLARQVGIGPTGAVVAGMIFAFSPPRFFRLGQLHLTTVQWLPFGLAAFHAYLDSGRRRSLHAAAGLFSLQALTSGHGAVFLGLSMLALWLYRTVLGDPLALGRRVRDFGLVGAALLAPAVLVILPYRAVQQELGLRRTLENWGVSPESFLASPTHLHAQVLALTGGSRLLEQASAYLFPGYLPLLLALMAVFWRVPRERRSRTTTARPVLAFLAGLLEVVALVGFLIAGYVTVLGPIRVRVGDVTLLSVRDTSRAWLMVGASLAFRVAMARAVPLRAVPGLRSWRDRAKHWADGQRRHVVTFYGLLTACALWLSVGPPLGAWPLVYWLPGFNFIRVPSRFTILAMLGLALLAAAGFERLTERFARRTQVAAGTLVVALLTAEFVAVPLAAIPARLEIPAVDRWISGQPDAVVVAEVPLPDPRSAGPFERRQTAYMLHSMAHWRKTVHGYSGIRPPEHEALYALLHRFPDEASLERLLDFGVTHVVVHTEWYAPDERRSVEARLERAADWLRLEHDAGTGRVYALRHPRRTARAR